MMTASTVLMPQSLLHITDLPHRTTASVQAPPSHTYKGNPAVGQTFLRNPIHTQNAT